MRVLGTVLQVVMIVVASVGLIGGGFGAALWGFSDQNAARYTYKVGFKHPGDDCGNHDLSVDLADGVPLKCGAPGVVPYDDPEVDLHGFDDEQNAEVLTLSKQLGAEGFTPAEREQLQNRVDQIVASLPPDRLPQHPWLWGWKIGVLGLLAMSVPITGYVVVSRRA